MSDSALPPQQNPPVRRGRRRPSGPSGSSGPLGFVWASTLMAWRWLTRMRTALYLLFTLALLSIVATAVPQEPNVPSTVAAWRSGEEGPGQVVAGLLDAFGAFDVYGSGVFLALLLLLYISLTACLIPRIRAWVRLVRRGQPPIVRRLGAQDERASFTTALSPAAVHERASRVLTQRRWRVRRHEPGDDDRRPAQVAAEKGLWLREGGSLLFHLSFYVLLAAIVVGQLVTFEGQRAVVEGEPGFRDTAVSYWSYNPGRWFGEGDHDGWLLELEEFHVDWVRDPLAPGAGQPTEFRSEVRITPRDGEPFDGVIDSNAPLNLAGMRITQLDWGYAPRVVVEVDGEVVHDTFLTPVITDGGFFRGAVKAPAADPDLGLDIFLYPYAPNDDEGQPVPTGAPWAEAPLLVIEQYRGDLQLGATQQTINTLDTSALTSEGFAALRPGQEIEVGDATIRFPELRRWVGFQVSSRPQVPYLLFGALLLLGGLIGSLYASRRRLWVVAAADAASGRTLVTVAGRAFQRPEAFEEEHQELVAEIASVTDADPDDPDDRDEPSASDPDHAGASPAELPTA
ncbi:MAG: cytochrome c biogenesis protein ResB [Nitriliruptoraceae bacterium]